jgi:hypothetical protein
MFQALLTEARHRQQSKKIHGKEKNQIRRGLDDASLKKMKRAGRRLGCRMTKRKV